MSSDTQNILDLLFGLFALAVEVGCLAFFVIAFCFSWRYLSQTWRGSLVTAVVTFLLSLPSIIAAAWFIDVRHFAGEIDAASIPLTRFFGVMVAVGLMLLMMPLRALYYHVAACQWGYVRNAPEPTLAGPPGTRLPGTFIGIGVGAIILGLTLLVFHAAHVGERQGGDDWLKLFPGLFEMPRVLVAIVMATFASLYAVIEELIFRGGLLGYLLRITGNKTGLAWVWIVLVSLLWAVLHYPNTDQPLVKISQIFFMGLAQGGMMRRWGIAPAIGAHVTLNAGAVVVSLIFPQLN